MRKIFTLLTAILLIVASAQADSKSMFSLDVDHVYAEMAELTQLENYLHGSDATLSSLVDQNHSLVSNMKTGNFGWHAMIGLAEPPLGIPSFLWGFCLGLPGLAVVYFLTEDSAETRKALWGCIISGVIVGGFYIVWGAFWATSSAWYY
jgi:hypothetical protein